MKRSFSVQRTAQRAASNNDCQTSAFLRSTIKESKIVEFLIIRLRPEVCEIRTYLSIS